MRSAWRASLRRTPWPPAPAAADIHRAGRTYLLGAEAEAETHAWHDAIACAIAEYGSALLRARTAGAAQPPPGDDRSAAGDDDDGGASVASSFASAGNGARAAELMSMGTPPSLLSKSVADYGEAEEHEARRRPFPPYPPPAASVAAEHSQRFAWSR